MSSLHDFCSGRPRNMPNEVHDVPPRNSIPESPMIPEAARRLCAEKSGQLHPALYYAEFEQIPCNAGTWESPHTVDDKLQQREEFPTG